MSYSKSIGKSLGLIIAIGVAGLTISAYGQQRKDRTPPPPPQRQAPPPQRRNNPPAQETHARREGVRTPTYVGRTQGGTFQQMPPLRQQVPQRIPPVDRTVVGNRQPTPQPRQVRRQLPPQIVHQRTFTKTSSGRVYDNGLRLRKGIAVAPWQKEYFRKGHVHFPYYRQTYIPGRTFYSPFSFFFGICVPVIDISVCDVLPPPVQFIDYTAYDGDRCVGYQSTSDYNMINDPDLDQKEPGLNNALDELTETFQGGNIDGIVSLINPNLNVAIFMHNQYRYSLHANDYIDMTRDLIQSVQTVSFSLDYLHQRSPTVFTVSGEHVYQDQNGNSRTVYMSFVLQDIGGLWTLTQVGTSPDIMQTMH